MLFLLLLSCSVADMCLPDLSLRGHNQTHHCSPDLAGSRGAQCLSSCFFLALTLCLPLQSLKEMLSFFPSPPLLCMTQLEALLLALSPTSKRSTGCKGGEGQLPFSSLPGKWASCGAESHLSFLILFKWMWPTVIYPFLAPVLSTGCLFLALCSHCLGT